MHTTFVVLIKLSHEHTTIGQISQRTVALALLFGRFASAINAHHKTMRIFGHQKYVCSRGGKQAQHCKPYPKFSRALALHAKLADAKKLLRMVSLARPPRDVCGSSSGKCCCRRGHSFLTFKSIIVSTWTWKELTCTIYQRKEALLSPTDTWSIDFEMFRKSVVNLHRQHHHQTHTHTH